MDLRLKTRDLRPGRRGEEEEEEREGKLLGKYRTTLPLELRLRVFKFSESNNTFELRP